MRTFGALVLVLAACGPEAPAMTTADASSSSTGTGADATSTSGHVPTTTSPAPDLPGEQACGAMGRCRKVDVLFVVDDSRDMGPVQQRLAAASAELVEMIRDATTFVSDKTPLDAQIMVTSTDVGHVLCDGASKPGHQPTRGAPVATPCSERIERFISVDGEVDAIDLCASACPSAVRPDGAFIRFAGDEDNIVGEAVGDRVSAALACLLPQGIDGCAMASPLAAIRMALDPSAAWNSGPQPFSRPGVPLIIVVATHRTDCSTADPAFFDPASVGDPALTQFWALDPATQTRTGPTAAICWNAGMSCEAPDDEGVYPSCTPIETPALESLEDHVAFLNDEVVGAQGKDTLMALFVGVPPVTEYEFEPPFFPTKGGAFDLVHRTWRADDLAPGDPQGPADKEFQWGIGPGCGEPGFGLPPGRLEALCRSLDRADDPATDPHEERQRCCIESICDPDPRMFCAGGSLYLRGPFELPTD